MSRLRFLACAAVVAVGVSGCTTAAAVRPPTTPSPHLTTPAQRPKPVVHPAPTRYLAGQTVHIVDAADGVALALTASRPSVSTTRLSTSYGYGPAHGYYVTFQMTIRNNGQAPVPVQVTQFVVDEPGDARVTVNDGNAPYSGEPRTLDSTAVLPGDTDSGALTYDVPGTHGVLRYVQNGRTVCSWVF